MARQIKYVRVTLANGETRLMQVKTTTENYIRKVIADLILPAKAIRWEVV